MPGHDLVNVTPQAVSDHHEAQAQRFKDGADKARKELHTMIRGVGSVFGDAVYLVLERQIESLTENNGEAVYHLERAVSDKQREIDNMRAHTARSQQTLVFCAERILAKYAKARKPLPDDLSQVVCMAAVATGWGYLFPPTHDDHEHELDSADACRNPMCKYVGEEVPF